MVMLLYTLCYSTLVINRMFQQLITSSLVQKVSIYYVDTFETIECVVVES
jgi:hypothetical protein